MKKGITYTMVNSFKGLQHFFLLSSLALFFSHQLKGDLSEISAENNGGSRLLSSLSFNVVLEPFYYTTIFSEVSAQVTKVHKRMGDSFEKDEVLVDLKNGIYLANYAKAKAAVTKYQSELDAIKILYEDEAMSLFELNSAYASLASSEADLQEAKRFLDATQIKAPYKGKVVHLAVKEYELAQQSKELITIVNDNILYAAFFAPSSLLKSLRLGLPVDIEIRETGQTIAAKITRIAPVIDPSSSTIKLEAQIENSRGIFWGGMTGTARMTGLE